LGAGLTASRFVSGAQVGSGRVWATSKALLSRDDEPVIGFATDIGASGRGALHGCNQMRIAQLGQSETSRKISDCKSNFKIEAAKKGDRHECSERDIRAKSEATRDRVPVCDS
jgi:hypothetical protein